MSEPVACVICGCSELTPTPDFFWREKTVNDGKVVCGAICRGCAPSCVLAMALYAIAGTQAAVGAMNGADELRGKILQHLASVMLLYGHAVQAGLMATPPEMDEIAKRVMGDAGDRTADVKLQQAPLWKPGDPIC